MTFFFFFFFPPFDIHIKAVVMSNSGADCSYGGDVGPGELCFSKIGKSYPQK